MKFRHQSAFDDLELNITPLIDVVFLLLIFFMVSTTFQRESELTLQLPRSADTPPDVPTQGIEVLINAAGEYYVNDRELVQSDLGALMNALDKLSAGVRDTPVTIRADAQTPHQAVVTAMDAASQLGMSRMTIATTHSP